MIRSAITLSLVPQARGGPFVFWDDLDAACAQAAALGFDAIEIFAPSPAALTNLRPVLVRHPLQLAALGTGGGWVIHKWHLTHPEGAVRQKALDFVRGFMDAAAPFGAGTILGSMQGRTEGSANREQALDWLSKGLLALDEHAKQLGSKLFFEPLNRYETNLLNSVSATADLLRKLNTQNLRVLGDLFHMNIEETNICESLKHAGPLLGHVHLADSNRRAAGFGHLDLPAIARTLAQMNYSGYLSGEVLPLPSSDQAARQQVEAFRRLFPRN